jgi:hypothetical protein
MSAPTEREIRAILEPAKAAMADSLGEAIHEATSLIGYTYPHERAEAYVGGVWDNLRPSEEGRLEGHIEAAYTDLYDSLAQAIVDRVTTAALRFAKEYPNAPRVARKADQRVPAYDPSPIAPQ